MKINMLTKRGISIIAGVCLLSTTSVVAADEKIIRSQGEYIINNPDGTEVKIDTNDIEENAQALKELFGQIGGAAFRYGTEKEMQAGENDTKNYYWSKNSSGEWVKIGAVGSALPSDVINGVTFSSESGVDIEGTMPAPTEGTVNYYTGGNNESLGTTISEGSTISIENSTDTKDTADNHEANANIINLGVNEKVYIPYGYYNSDVIINNAILNNGTVESFLDNNNTNIIPEAYYLDSDITKSIKYQQLVERLKAIFGDKWTIGDSPSFDEISELFDDNISTTRRITQVIGNKVSNPSTNTWLTGSNALTGPQSFNLASNSGSAFNLGLNEQITIPAGHYENSVNIKNAISNKTTGNVTISSSRTFPAGYYDSFTVTASSPDNGTATFYHHVHSTESTDETVTSNGASKTTDGLNDNYIADISGGCFTKEIVHTHNSTCYGNGHTHTAACYSSHTHTNACYASGVLTCEIEEGIVLTCEKEEGVGEPTCGMAEGQILGYELSCGRTKGEVVKIDIIY
jgi:hypothetical protein